jgi:FSR family fosmidomycin resistance protein-like MFS transporter
MADRYGRKIVITVSLAVLTPLMLVFLGLHSFAAASLLLVAVGLALSASNSVVVVMAQEFLPNRVGFAAGVTLGLSMTIGGLMMPLFGSIADHHGLTPTLFLLSIVPALSCALSLTLHEPGTNPPATS